ncbi:hypothetical protein HNP55_001958 [Paucibacter oligotrophus]|uniref:Transmembrane protein n=1 Tax=Roseateles oligotrophus TaxID=1769250 RepID=A0A840LBF9_9BURK|nr:hypothetical protein [Roseateles oligotrophus]MBB4843439.1 hypothetical protein [Roseateles oligotrophus]
MLKLLIAPLRWLMRLLLALLILFEEWGWQPLARALARLGQLPLFRQLEGWIRGLPPYAALALLVLPSLLILPVKLGALWLITQGRSLLGLGLILAAKLVGTAVVARLFQLIQPALMQLPWFARLYARWSVWKQGLLGWLRSQPAWRLARLLKRRLRRFRFRF